MVNIPFLFILIVGGVIFLGVLGKKGWSPVMRVLLVLAVVPLALLFVAHFSYQRAYQPRPSAHLQFENALPTFVNRGPGETGFVTVSQKGVEPVARRGGGTVGLPAGNQVLVSQGAGNAWTPGWGGFEAQARLPVRGVPVILLVPIVLGAVAFFVIYQVRRGAWTRPVWFRGGALALSVCVLVIFCLRWVSQEQSRERAEQVAQSIRISMATAPVEEAPRMRALDTPETSQESRRYRDVEVWRRESVLGFVSSSSRPDWCREGLETEPEARRVQDTVFLSALPKGRDWLAGYSSQYPEIEPAQREALASARHKLALEALLQVKTRVPEVDVRPLEDLAERLALRYSYGQHESTYVEEATLKHEQRTYGTVYRVAVRIRADAETIDAFARRICRHIDSVGSDPQVDLRVAFFSGMILVVLAFSAFLVYVLFRAGATGRWAFPLRLLSSGMLAAIIAAVVYVSMHLGEL